MGQYAQLTETVHRGWDSIHNSPRQFTEDETVHITHRDSSQRTRKYIELTECTEDGTVYRTHRVSAQRTGEYTDLTESVHRGRVSTHTGTQYTADWTVHTNHQNTVLKMGRYTHHGTHPTENEAVKTTHHDTFRNGCDSTHTSPGHTPQSMRQYTTHRDTLHRGWDSTWGP